MDKQQHKLQQCNRAGITAVPQFKHNSNIIIAGRSNSGKTFLCISIVKNANWLFDTPPKRVLWCYGQKQDHIFKALRGYPVEFHYGVPDFDTRKVDVKIPKLLVLDDLLSSADKALERIFLYQSHHLNFTTIYLVQNLFFQSPINRNISLNAHYLVLFSNSRDSQQALHLFRQISPKNTKFLESVYNEISDRPYDYIFLDLHPETPKIIRVRSDILNPLGCTVYLDKTENKCFLPSSSEAEKVSSGMAGGAEEICENLKKISKIIKTKKKLELYFKLDASDKEIILLKECCLNILKGVVAITAKQLEFLKQHKNIIRILGNVKADKFEVIKCRKLIAANTVILPYIVAPCLSHFKCN
jgi:hypothetical protein